jgi:hypothetical protein
MVGMDVDRVFGRKCSHVFCHILHCFVQWREGEMKIHYVPHHVSIYNNEEELGKMDKDCINELNIDEAWYWYAVSEYEGDGYLLMRKGCLWAIHDMSHCSCFGPTDRIEELAWMEKDKLAEKYSEEMLRGIKPLIDVAWGGPGK